MRQFITHLFAFACGLLLPLELANRTAAVRSDTIKIGALLCLSGECAEWGNNSLNGIKLAVEQANSRGGVKGKKLALVVQDSGEGVSPLKAVQGLDKLLSDPEIRFIIGPTWSPAGMAIAPVAAKHKEVLFASPSLGVADFNATAGNIFNLWPHDEVATRAVARHAFQKGARRVAILSSQHTWVQTQRKAFTDEFEKLGGVIATLEEPAPFPDAATVKGIASKAVFSGADSVFIADLANMGAIAKELTALRFQGTRYAILMDQTRIESAQGALEGASYARYADSSPEFQEQYHAKFGSDPGVSSDTSFDTVQSYVRAVSAADSLVTDAVQQKLLAVNFNGASGHVQFDSAGGVVKEPELWVVAENKQQPLTAVLAKNLANGASALARNQR